MDKLILKFLDITYGDCKLFETETSFSISGICLYFKNTKQVGFTGDAHLDLVRTFGDGNYYSVMQKWFYEKYNLGN
jgi:hypothetical protein